MSADFPFHGCEPNLRHHLDVVLRGEYHTPGFDAALGGRSPVVLDIGANLGAFSWWARQSWPTCVLHAYEACAQNALYFERNLGFPPVCAVVYPTRETSMKLYFSGGNAGEKSVYPEHAGYGSHAGFTISPVLHPDALPACDFLKMDIEGVEPLVLSAYLLSHPLPLAIAYEYHSASDDAALREILASSHILVRSHDVRPHRGTLCWLKVMG